MVSFDKDWLIKKVNENPSSPYFPILSYIYLEDEELKLASHICKNGLKAAPESIEGNFIIAQIHILENNLQEAEKVLKFVVHRHSAHVNAWKLLFRIQKDLNRNEKIIKSSATSLLKIKPNDDECSNWLKNLVKSKEVQIEEQITKKVIQKDTKQNQSVTIPEQVVPISMRMATFTLAEVYQNQGYFHQALEVLKIVEQKGGNKRRLRYMRIQIKECIKAQLEAESE